MCLSNISGETETKFENILASFSGAQMEFNHKKVEILVRKMSWPPATKYILIGVVPFLCDSARRQLSNFSVQYILLSKLFVTLHQFVSKLFVTTHQVVVQTLYSNASGFCPNSLWQCIWLLFKLFVTVHLVAVQTLCYSASGCCSNSLWQCI